MKLAIIVLAAILLYGCASGPGAPAPPAENDGGESSPDQSSGTGTGDSVTLGDGGDIKSGSVEDGDTVSGGGSMGMVKANDSGEEPVKSGSGGQIVDVGGSLPAR
ncbi:MAG: hypothetical protein AB1324_07285 [Candidatus Micrarchaeota archaeon]